MRRTLHGALDAELAPLALLEPAPDPRPEHERRGKESQWAEMEAAAESAGRLEAEGNAAGRRWGQGRGATLAPPVVVTAEIAARLDLWAQKKREAWEAGDAKLRVKCETNAALEVWIEKQKSKAVATLKQSAEKLWREVEQERAAERASPAHAQAAATSPAHRALPAPPPPSPTQFSKIV